MITNSSKRLFIVDLVGCLFLLVQLLSVDAVPFKCPQCRLEYCTSRYNLQCKGGYAKDICGCCDICAKTLSESCGGEYNYLGQCDRGLVCISSNALALLPDTVYSHSKSIGFVNAEVQTGAKGDMGKFLPEGRCYPRHPMVNDEASDTCEPACTPEFCARKPSAICSATNTAIEKHSCHGTCQHTVCMACRFEPQHGCTKCAKDDYHCLRLFAKCRKRQICTRQKYPCYKRLTFSSRSTQKRIRDEKQNGRFICELPQCL